MSERVEFVSYDGKYPNLCRGTLILKINGKKVILNDCLRSGGGCWFDKEWNDHIERGKWSIEVPKEYEYLTGEITDVVNDNVSYGCCGGCL